MSQIAKAKTAKLSKLALARSGLDVELTMQSVHLSTTSLPPPEICKCRL